MRLTLFYFFYIICIVTGTCHNLKTVIIMEKIAISTGTVTYAIKGRDLLKKIGIKAYVERAVGPEKIGCGYRIIAVGNRQKILDVLNQNSIKILDVKNI